jgi:hypothetical protein
MKLTEQSVLPTKQHSSSSASLPNAGYTTVFDDSEDDVYDAARQPKWSDPNDGM